MKKLFSTLLALSMIAVLLSTYFVANAETYVSSSFSKKGAFYVMPGYKDKSGTNISYPVRLTKDGLQVTYTSGAYPVDPLPSFNPTTDCAGVIYSVPITYDNFSVEFTINKAPGDYFQNSPSSADAWVSLSLLDKPLYYHINQPSKGGRGIVNLIWPQRPNTLVDQFQNILGLYNGAIGTATLNKNPQSSFKYEFKRDSAGALGAYMDGKRLETVNDWEENKLSQIFLGKKAYFMMGMSSSTASQYIQFTITKVNGVSVKGTDAAVNYKGQEVVANTTGNNTTVTAKTTTQAGVVATTSASATSQVASISSVSQSASTSNTEANQQTTASALGTNADKNSSLGLIIGIAALVLLLAVAAIVYFIKKGKVVKK